MRKMPSAKPTIIAHSAPAALSRLKNTPKKKTTKIGGARYPCTACKYVYSPDAPLMTGIQASATSTIAAVAMRPTRTNWCCDAPGFHFS